VPDHDPFLAGEAEDQLVRAARDTTRALLWFTLLTGLAVVAVVVLFFNV
jgi:hypothetical protein